MIIKYHQKRKYKKKRHKSVTKNSRKKKQSVSIKNGHGLFSLKLTKSTSYSPTAKKPKSNNTGVSTPNISIDTTVYNDNNPHNRLSVKYVYIFVFILGNNIRVHGSDVLLVVQMSIFV